MAASVEYVYEYANQVQVFSVSASKRFYFIKSGELRGQKKRFETSIANPAPGSKNTLVHYTLRDCYSGAGYTESHPLFDLPELDDFLYRAWSPKPEPYGPDFFGLPTYLAIPKATLKLFPQLEGLSKFTRIIEPPTSIGTVASAVSSWERYFQPLFSLMGHRMSFAEYNAQRHRKTNRKSGHSLIDHWRKGLRGEQPPVPIESDLRDVLAAASV